MDNAQIAAKCVEISKCLINRGSGLYTFDLDDTRKIGNIARFAANIRQSEQISEQQLAAIADTLKQDYSIVRSDTLPFLEELGWVEAYKEGRKIIRIEEYLPPLEDILSTLGKQWKENEPSPIDVATVSSLSKLSDRPMTKDALISEVGIENEKFDITLEYGGQANYLGTFMSEEFGKETVWTPLYWAGKLDTVLNFLNRQTYDEFKALGTLTREFLKYPGRPEDRTHHDRKSLVDAGVAHGYFPSVAVTDRKNDQHEYIFAAAPEFEVNPQKDIFEKARLIVACIRHGQYNAEVTRIKYPVLLLHALRENRIAPHSYAKIQYALLIVNGICTYKEVPTSYGIGYQLKFNDTPENNAAADTAEQMLKGQDPSSGAVSEPEVKELLITGLFNYSSEQRRMKSTTQISAKGDFDRLMEYLQGVTQ